METREARRRKILARGSDRLAFITGEKPTFSSAPPQPTIAPSVFSVDPSSPTTARSGDAALILLSDSSSNDRVAIEDAGISTSSSLQPATVAKFDVDASISALKDVRQQLRGINVAETRGIPSVESIATVQDGTSQANDDERRSTNSEAQQFDTKTGRFVHRQVTSPKSIISLVTCHRLARCIDATEKYRVSGALLLALFLIAQSFSFCAVQPRNPLHKWVLPWPVALVIVIDVSLVFGALLLGCAGPSSFGQGRKDENILTQVGQLSQAFELAGKLEHFLEVGTVLLKTSQAFLLDCSIYIVILTSGYSLLKLWQPADCPLIGQL